MVNIQIGTIMLLVVVSTESPDGLMALSLQRVEQREIRSEILCESTVSP